MPGGLNEIQFVHNFKFKYYRVTLGAALCELVRDLREPRARTLLRSQTAAYETEGRQKLNVTHVSTYNGRIHSICVNYSLFSA